MYVIYIIKNAYTYNVEPFYFYLHKNRVNERMVFLGGGGECIWLNLCKLNVGMLQIHWMILEVETCAELVFMRHRSNWATSFMIPLIKVFLCNGGPYMPSKSEGMHFWGGAPIGWDWFHVSSRWLVIMGRVDLHINVCCIPCLCFLTDFFFWKTCFKAVTFTGSLLFQTLKFIHHCQFCCIIKILVESY
jgi:hypothetical protein